MGKITWCEAEPKVFSVPRIEDSQIDDLFYQEDEIGEMRHYAFMIECGLEEEDWGGPDVEPIPWPGNGNNSDSSAEKPKQVEKKPVRPKVPQRTRSSDDLDVLTAKEDEEPIKKEPPARRKLVATKSGTLHSMRAAAAKEKADDKEDEAETKAAPRVRPTPARRKITASKSGSMHQLRQRRAQLAAKEEEEEEKTNAEASGGESPGRGVPGRRKLVATKSGTLHGMRKKAQDVAKMASTAAASGITDGSSDSSPTKPLRRRIKPADSTDEKNDEPPSTSSRLTPKRGSLTTTRSGSGLKRVSRTSGGGGSKNLNDSATSLNSSFNNSFNASSSSVTKSPGSYKVKLKDSKPKEPIRQISMDDSDEEDNSNDSASVSIGSDDDEPKKPAVPKVTSKVAKNGRSRITVVKDSKKYTTPASPIKSPVPASPVKRNWTPNGTTKSRVKVTKEDIKPPLSGSDEAPVRRTSTSREQVKESMKAFKTGNKSASELLKQFQTAKSKDSSDLPPAFAAINSTSRTRVRPKGTGAVPKKAQSMIVGSSKFGKKDDDDKQLPPAFRQLRSKAG